MRDLFQIGLAQKSKSDILQNALASADVYFCSKNPYGTMRVKKIPYVPLNLKYRHLKGGASYSICYTIRELSSLIGNEYTKGN